jgi:beta-glucosidase
MVVGKIYEGHRIFEKGSKEIDELRSYVSFTEPIERLGIPAMKANDGPTGFRVRPERNDSYGTSTQYPSAMSMASTWNPEAVYKWSHSMAKEFYDKGS